MPLAVKIHRLAAPLYKPETRKMGQKVRLIVRKLRYFFFFNLMTSLVSLRK